MYLYCDLISLSSSVCVLLAARVDRLVVVGQILVAVVVVKSHLVVKRGEADLFFFIIRGRQRDLVTVVAVVEVVAIANLGCIKE